MVDCWIFLSTFRDLALKLEGGTIWLNYLDNALVLQFGS